MYCLCERRWFLVTIVTLLATGCQSLRNTPVAESGVLLQSPQQAGPVGIDCTNPRFVPVTNQDWAWEQIIDVVDDYFRIDREHRVEQVGTVMTEGHIDTLWQVGATWMEPHRPDSAGWDNRWESTFQTIRRRAVVRVFPAQGGYLVDLTVFKELEDLPRPENSTSGAATLRHDNALPSRLDEKVSRTRFSENWIPLGRDCEVEQQMLIEIGERVVGG